MTTISAEITEDVFVLKVDTQGWEPQVFIGALQLLTKCVQTYDVQAFAVYHVEIYTFVAIGIL